jgi:integrase
VYSDSINHKCLWRSDIEVHSNYLIVTIKWSKTIQFGDRIVQIPLLKLDNSPLCPYQAFQDLIKYRKGQSNEPLFILSNGKAVTYYLFQKKFRSCISQLGLDPLRFSTHSFRRGFATFAFKNNIAADQIQILGDWHSDVYKQYISLSIEDKLDIYKSLSHHFYFD